MKTFSGIITAMVTPMHADETVHYDALRRQTQRQLNGGVHGLFALGTNGEAYVLDETEKLKTAQTVIDEAAGKVPVLVGTGCISTRETVALSRKVQQLGADALSIVCPYFAAASQEDLYGHYAAIAEAVDIPILLYNIPMRTGVNLEAETVARLAQIPNIIGVKDSSGSFDQILKYIAKTPDDFTVLAGTDSLVLWTLMAGGRGGICGVANVFPKILSSIYDLWTAGDLQGAQKAQEAIRPFRECFKFGGSLSVIKLAGEIMGLDMGPVRKPFSMPKGEARAYVENVLKTYYADQF